jgi:hypothetical protein
MRNEWGAFKCRGTDDCTCRFCRYERQLASHKEEEMPEEGKKNDSGKLRYDLVPYDALEEVVKTFTEGALKYGDRNWENGILYHRVYAAAMRHLVAFWKGAEINEEDFGCHHLAHAICCCMFLLAYRLRKMDEFDDRPKLPQ